MTAPVPTARLVALDDDTRKLLADQGLGLALALKGDYYLLGRSVNPKEGLKIPSGMVRFSSTHAKIARELKPEGWQFFCLDSSTNGTYVNDEKLQKNKARVLKSGDVVRLSFKNEEDSPVLEFRFEIDEAEKEPSAAEQLDSLEPAVVQEPSVTRPAKRRASPEPEESAHGNALKRQASDTGAGRAPFMSPSDAPRASPAARVTPNIKQPPAPSPAPATPASAQPAAAADAPSARADAAAAAAAGAGQLPAASPAAAAAAPADRVAGAAGQQAPESGRVSGVAGGEDTIKQAQALYFANQELRSQAKEQRRQHQKLIADHEAAMRQMQTQHKDEVNKLHERLIAAEAQLRQQSVQLAASNGFETELAETKARLASNHAELQTLRTDTWTLKQELGKSRAAEQMLAEQVKELTQALTAEQTARAAAQEDVQAARAALSAESVLLAAARRTVDETAQEQAALRQENAARQAECEALRAQLSDLTRRTGQYERKMDEAEELADRLTFQTMMAHAASSKALAIDQKLQEAIRFLTNLQMMTGPFANVDMPQLCSGTPPPAAAAAMTEAAHMSQAAAPTVAAPSGGPGAAHFAYPGAVGLVSTQIQSATQHQGTQVHAMAPPTHSPVAPADRDRDALVHGFQATLAAGTQVLHGYHMPVFRHPAILQLVSQDTPTKATSAAAALSQQQQPAAQAAATAGAAAAAPVAFGSAGLPPQAQAQEQVPQEQQQDVVGMDIDHEGVGEEAGEEGMGVGGPQDGAHGDDTVQLQQPAPNPAEQPPHAAAEAHASQQNKATTPAPIADAPAGDAAAAGDDAPAVAAAATAAADDAAVNVVPESEPQAGHVTGTLDRFVEEQVERLTSLPRAQQGRSPTPPSSAAKPGRLSIAAALGVPQQPAGSSLHAAASPAPAAQPAAASSQGTAAALLAQAAVATVVAAARLTDDVEVPLASAVDPGILSYIPLDIEPAGESSGGGLVRAVPLPSAQQNGDDGVAGAAASGAAQEGGSVRDEPSLGLGSGKAGAGLAVASAQLHDITNVATGSAREGGSQKGVDVAVGSAAKSQDPFAAHGGGSLGNLRASEPGIELPYYPSADDGASEPPVSAHAGGTVRREGSQASAGGNRAGLAVLRGAAAGLLATQAVLAAPASGPY